MESEFMENEYPTMWRNTYAVSFVLNDAKYISLLKGSDCKALFVDKVVFAEDPLFAKILGPFVNGINGLNNTYEFKFEEGQLADLMEEYFFFKEELCTY